MQNVARIMQAACSDQHQQDHHDAVSVGHAGAQRNERVHVGLAAAEPGESCHVERPAGPELHRRRNRPQGQRIPPNGQQPIGPRQSGKARQQQGGTTDHCDRHAPAQVALFAVPGGIRRLGRPVDIKAIAGVGYGTGEIVQRRVGCTDGVKVDRGPGCGQIHRNVGNSRDGAYRLAHMMHTCSAGHPRNGEDERIGVRAGHMAQL